MTPLPAHSPSTRQSANFVFQDARTKLRFPVFSGVTCRSFLDHEPEIKWAIENLLSRKHGAFVDVGANIGQTLLKVILCDRSRDYIGFELQSACIMYVEEFIRLNKIETARIMPMGLGSENRIRRFYSNHMFDPCASVDGGFREPGFYKDFRYGSVRRGDDVLRELGVGDIAVIKIDVEGGEADVIEGLTDTIAEKRPFLICEILPGAHVGDEKISAHRRELMERIRRTIERHSYHAYRILPPGRLEEAESFDSDVYVQELCNYLFSPATLAPDLTVSGR